MQIENSIVYELGIETTKILNDKQEELHNINWSNGEANIDIEYSKIACDCCVIVWNKMKIKYPEFKEIDIKCYTPDINIIFIDSNNKNLKYKIELKSSKSKIMPGSTIKNLDINQTLIYCLRPSNKKNKSQKFKLKCSQYYYAMGHSDTELFQDRTPRPFINFDKMNDIDNILPFRNKEKDSWIEHYAKCGLKRIDNSTSCKKSWQDDMIIIMKKLIIKDYISKTTIKQFKLDKKEILTNENI
jgi:hypothetical protein